MPVVFLVSIGYKIYSRKEMSTTFAAKLLVFFGNMNQQTGGKGLFSSGCGSESTKFSCLTNVTFWNEISYFSNDNFLESNNSAYYFL